MRQPGGSPHSSASCRHRPGTQPERARRQPRRAEARLGGAGGSGGARAQVRQEGGQRRRACAGTAGGRAGSGARAQVRQVDSRRARACTGAAAELVAASDTWQAAPSRSVGRLLEAPCGVISPCLRSPRGWAPLPDVLPPQRQGVLLAVQLAHGGGAVGAPPSRRTASVRAFPPADPRRVPRPWALEVPGGIN